MGNSLKSLWNRLFSRKQAKILIMGLSGVGKTTLLYRISQGQVIKTTPTVGFNVETFTHQNVRFQAFDLAGSEKMRGVLNTYYQGTSAIIYVVDSSDPLNFHHTHEDIKARLNDPALRALPVLFFANKQDKSNCVRVSDLSALLGLNDIANTWHMEGVSALTGNGLMEGLNWLVARIQGK